MNATRTLRKKSGSRQKTLSSAQQWFVNAIVKPSAPRALAHQLGGAAVPATTGLGIYRHAYRARLVDCLADDFPALRSLVQEETFTRLAHAVIKKHPPTDCTLNRYSRWVPYFLLKNMAFTSHGRLAYDLARLEWALVRAIHAPLAPALDLSGLHNLQEKHWSKIRMVPVPSLTLIRSRWPINTCYRQYIRDQNVTAPLPATETVAVLRNAVGLERHVFTPAQATLLTRLMRGSSLGQALHGSRLKPEDVQLTLTSIISSGSIARIIIPTRITP